MSAYLPHWQIELSVPKGASDAFEAVLEPLSLALSSELSGATFRLTALTAGQPDPQRLNELLQWACETAEIPMPQVRVLPLPQVDWLRQNQRDLVPITTRRFRIRGSHQGPSMISSVIDLEIDAGQAFGTGHHATTMGCLVVLERMAPRRRYRHMLDLGCGTGILAMAMARLWRHPVAAIDIDPVAVKVARRNVKINGLAGLIRPVVGDGPARKRDSQSSRYELVVANILAGPLEHMAPRLARALMPGGETVLSGILAHQSPAVEHAYRQQGLHLIHRHVLSGWTTLLLSKPPAPPLP